MDLSSVVFSVLLVLLAAALAWCSQQVVTLRRRNMKLEREMHWSEGRVRDLTAEAEARSESVALVEQHLDDTSQVLREAQARAEVEARRAKELFDVVEKVLAERDQWRDMWHEHGRQHAAAQAILEQALVDVRVALRSALIAVNGYRKQAGQEPVPFGLEPGEKPVGTAAKFQELLEKCIREAPPSVDGVALRDEVMAK